MLLCSEIKMVEYYNVGEYIIVIIWFNLLLHVWIIACPVHLDNIIEYWCNTPFWTFSCFYWIWCSRMIVNAFWLICGIINVSVWDMACVYGIYIIHVLALPWLLSCQFHMIVVYRIRQYVHECSVQNKTVCTCTWLWCTE